MRVHFKYTILAGTLRLTLLGSSTECLPSTEPTKKGLFSASIRVYAQTHISRFVHKTFQKHSANCTLQETDPPLAVRLDVKGHRYYKTPVCMKRWHYFAVVLAISTAAVRARSSSGCFQVRHNLCQISTRLEFRILIVVYLKESVCMILCHLEHSMRVKCPPSNPLTSRSALSMLNLTSALQHLASTAQLLQACSSLLHGEIRCNAFLGLRA